MSLFVFGNVADKPPEEFDTLEYHRIAGKYKLLPSTRQGNIQLSVYQSSVVVNESRGGQEF